MFCTHVCLKPGFYVSQGTIQNEYKNSQLKIYVAIAIKHSQLILYSIKNAK
jgi:hypothetical protein